MSSCYDIDHELITTLEQTLAVLSAVPVVGEAFTQAQSDAHKAGALNLLVALNSLKES